MTVFSVRGGSVSRKGFGRYQVNLPEGGTRPADEDAQIITIIIIVVIVVVIMSIMSIIVIIVVVIMILLLILIIYI